MWKRVLQNGPGKNVGQFDLNKYISVTDDPKVTILEKRHSVREGTFQNNI